MVFVRLEMQRNWTAGKCRGLKWRWIETDFYCNYNKEHHLLGEGISIRTIPMIWEDVQIIVGCQRYSLGVFITSANCQDSQGAEINDQTCYQTVCISSHLHLASLNYCYFLMLKIGKAKRMDSFADGLLSLTINLPIIFSINQVVREKGKILVFYFDNPG